MCHVEAQSLSRFSRHKHKEELIYSTGFFLHKSTRFTQHLGKAMQHSNTGAAPNLPNISIPTGTTAEVVLAHFRGSFGKLLTQSSIHCEIADRNEQTVSLLSVSCYIHALLNPQTESTETVRRDFQLSVSRFS